MDQYFTPSGVDFVRSHQAGQVPKVNAVEQRKFNIRTKADDAFTLDDFANRQSLASIDFIKIDTDGTDFDVLRGAEASLFKRNVLGVQIEAQFAGSTHPLTNTFANIDVFMRRQGFTLFSIPELNKYARMQIPGKFVHSFPSQGYFGQLLWCDAVYLRDVCRPDYFSNWPIEFGLDKLLNLLCLFDLYGLPDCGAELTLSFSDELTRSGIDPMPILNLFRQQADVIDPVS